jgi:Protein of unknown function (DUF2420)
VYYRLHQNDGVEEPHPLTVNLKTRPRFTARFNALVAAAGSAKGFTAVCRHSNERYNHEEVHDTAEQNETEAVKTETNDVENKVDADYEWAVEAREAEYGDTVQRETPDYKNDNRQTETRDTSAGGTSSKSVQVAPLSQEKILDSHEEPKQFSKEEEDLIDYTDDEEEALDDSGQSSSTVKGSVAQFESGQYLFASNIFDFSLTVYAETILGGVHVHALSSKIDDARIISETLPDGVSAHSMSLIHDANIPNLHPADSVAKHSPTQGTNAMTNKTLTTISPSLEHQVANDAVEASGSKAVNPTLVESTEENTYESELYDDPEGDYTYEDEGHEEGEVEEPADEDNFDIGWEDEEEVKAQSETKSESPLGKRTFDEHAEGVADSELGQGKRLMVYTQL